ncbi:MAG: hypothetical protein U1E78_04745 [Gammaproteobacteria bacterium]
MLSNLLINSIKYAKNNLIIGSSNKKEDLEETSGWTHCAWWRAYSYSKYVKNEENNWQLHKTSNIRRVHPTDMVENELLEEPYEKFSQLLSAYIVSNRLRMGNCGDHAAHVYCFLWQMATRYGCVSGIKRLEIISFDELDHQLIVVNRNIQSDPNNPSTWGWRDCRVIDAWWENGKILNGQNFFKKFKELTDYCRSQDKYINQLLNLSDDVSKSSRFTLIYDLKPSTLKFPDNIEKLISFDPLDFDLSLLDIDLKEDHAQHQKAFTPTLNAIQEKPLNSMRAGAGIKPTSEIPSCKLPTRTKINF